uniref:Uncharacterized protein n=1 Tax=Chlamydomonas leiostraca TaxID=1034604 RepID=A0A7S0RIX9_9CHLO|mmetsp:Transcript_23864/g.60800  ORF Transcript_23864/g.60800 Transcript_23864/m.60800 type:complete len:235 (+) Transcript_23864:202-906(+)
MVDLRQSRQQFDRGFAVGNDHFLLSLYMSIAAGIALIVPVLLVGPLAPGLGLDTSLSWSLGTTALASSFLAAVHFVASTVAAGAAAASAAFMHRHQALSLLATTQQVHMALAVTTWIRYPHRVPPDVWLCMAGYTALMLLAWCHRALTPAWTQAQAQQAASREPLRADGALALACRCTVAFVYWVMYARRAWAYAEQGFRVSHAALGLVAFSGMWIHFIVCTLNARTAARVKQD